jgi:hypothetical protein
MPLASRQDGQTQQDDQTGQEIGGEAEDQRDAVGRLHAQLPCGQNRPLGEYGRSPACRIDQRLVAREPGDDEGAICIHAAQGRTCVALNRERQYHAGGKGGDQRPTFGMGMRQGGPLHWPVCPPEKT